LNLYLNRWPTVKLDVDVFTMAPSFVSDPVMSSLPLFMPAYRPTKTSLTIVDELLVNMLKSPLVPLTTFNALC
jgi:hypothetical protein